MIGTGVQATTIHALLELDCELKAKLDIAKCGHPKVAELLALEVVFVDVLVDPFGIDPTEFIVLVVVIEMLANLGFVCERTLTVRTVGH